MIPSVGRIVHYKMGSIDIYPAVQMIQAGQSGGQHPAIGQTFPAIIVSTSGASEFSACNLQVFLDAQAVYWAPFKMQGTADGQWSEPPRVQQ